MTREELARLIREIALEAGQSLGVRLLESALTELATPRARYSQIFDFEIHERDLREAVSRIVTVAVETERRRGREGDRVTAARIRRAIAVSECHYLWFC